MTQQPLVATERKKKKNAYSHVLRGGGTEPVVRKDGARPEVAPVEERALYREVPVGERDGGVDRL